MDRRPVSLSGCAEGPLCETEAFPERTLVMIKKITITTASVKKNKEQGWNRNTHLGVNLKKTSLFADRHIINNKVALELANFLHRKMGLTQRRAFTQAHMAVELLDKLNKGRVEFVYEEADGTVHYAIGTKHPKLLPPAKETSKKRPEPAWPRDYFVYYDLVVEGFRTFKASKLRQIFNNDEVL